MAVNYKVKLSDKKYFTGYKKRDGTDNSLPYFKTKAERDEIKKLSDNDAQRVYEWIALIEEEKKYVDLEYGVNDGGVLATIVGDVRRKLHNSKNEFEPTRLYRITDYGGAESISESKDEDDEIQKETNRILEPLPSDPNMPASSIEVATLPANVPLVENPHAQTGKKLIERLKATASREDAEIVFNEATSYYQSSELEQVFKNLYESHISKMPPPLNSVAVDSNTFQHVPTVVAKKDSDITKPQQPILEPFVVSPQSPPSKPDTTYNPDRPLEAKKPEIKSPEVLPKPGIVKPEVEKVNELKLKVEKSNAQQKMQEALNAAQDAEANLKSDPHIGDRQNTGLETMTSIPRADIIEKKNAEQKKSMHTYADRTWVYSIQDSRLGNASSLKKITDMESEMRFKDTYQPVIVIPETQAEIIEKNKKFIKQTCDYRLTPLNQKEELTSTSYFSSAGYQKFDTRHVGDTPDTNRKQHGNGTYWDINKNPPKQDLGLTPMFERSESCDPNRFNLDHLQYSSTVYDTFDNHEMNI